MNGKQDGRKDARDGEPRYREELSVTLDGRYVGYVTNEQRGSLRARGPYFVRGPNLTYAEETTRYATIEEAAEALRASAKERGL